MSSDDMNQVQEDLERYGVWVKAGPDEITDQAGVGFELTDLDDLDENNMLITEEEEKMLGELEESTLPDFTESADTPPEEMDGESKQLLHKIEGEINALRGDILQLKNELTTLRSPEVSPTADSVPAPAPGGFFEDEDDETIALTGDELDNILDSADMTEEAGADETPDPADTSEINLIDDTEDDPAISILGSQQDSEEGGDEPETIEINIPGINDNETSDAFEEAVNQEIINISTAEADYDADQPIPSIGDIEMDVDEGESADQPIPSIGDIEMDVDEGESADQPIPSIGDIEMDVDEGESVEINLSALEDDAPDVSESDTSESGDIEIDEISLDDFEPEQRDDDLESINLDIVGSDELAVDEGQPLSDAGDIQLDDIDLAADHTDDIAADITDDISIDITDDITAPEDDIPDIQIDDIDLAADDAAGDAADSTIDIAGDTADPEGDIGDIQLDDIDLTADDAADITDDITADIAAPEDDIPDIQIDDIDLAADDAADGSADDAQDSTIDIAADDADLGDDIPDIQIDDIPEITLDMDSIESTDQFELDDEIEIPAGSDETVDAVPAPGEPEGGEFDSSGINALPINLREEMKEALTYMDDLLGSLPDEKITEFMQTRHYEVYKKIFKELEDS